MARRTALGLPVAAILGALAVAPQLAHSGPAARAASARQLAMARRSLQAQAVDLVAGQAAVVRNATARLASTSFSRQASAANRPAASGAHSQGAAASQPRGVVCASSASGPLPANYAAIVGFLTTHGYTGLAAAGIAGNIYQESMGNPESVGSGGGGLIGWTPLPGGFVTGNPAADLQTQLSALLSFNQIWASYIPALNAATSATQAADIYMTYFERPGIPAAYNREAAASAVAAACGL
jgi:hypothetical protein